MLKGTASLRHVPFGSIALLLQVCSQVLEKPIYSDFHDRSNNSASIETDSDRFNNSASRLQGCDQCERLENIIKLFSGSRCSPHARTRGGTSQLERPGTVVPGGGGDTRQATLRRAARGVV